ncbi:MAG TPA: hypothetical protein VFN10_13590 [Thermoanaerobaculia bacterium]|nr:hypothetical protein [Thermoanaerobaculia bacterium]
MRNTISRSGALLVFTLVLTACGTTTSPYALIRERDASRKQIKYSKLITELATTKPDLVYMRDAAVLSAAVYRRAAELPPVNGWTEMAGVPQPEPIAKRLHTAGLVYGVWVNQSTRPVTAMLVFRGTAQAADWYSNLRWITAAIPLVEDDYDQTIRLTTDIVKKIRETYGRDTVIYSAGHSLGGGLAQTAAYAACGDIKAAFAFDPSPVTKHRVENQCTPGHSAQHFYRIYERSEVLSHVRYAIRHVINLRQVNPHIMEVKVSLFNAYGIGAHSIQQLATQLDAVINQQAALTPAPAPAAPPSARRATAGGVE